MSVDPVTATLPVVPDNVHSGAPAFCGAAVGHVLVSVAVSVREGTNTSAIEDEDGPADEESDFVSDPHAASVTANDAAQAMSTTDEDTRGEFTAVHATARGCGRSAAPTGMFDPREAGNA
ncbi:hypothetical protein MMAGJ_64780 [Mycolicibacterium mageritense]|uniref:Uncharacterized protein n=1 Tax=Mycolicibacterium mageritense TaxID=53462 RepID=A0ABM7I2S8_MYCME|nr:hypothetical protein MMAGJ_64780 [Mycolicibacterium mageritense]